MLSPMTLTLPDLRVSADDLPVNTGLSADFSDFDASFGELLRMPISVGQRKVSTESGEILPVNGNDLPPLVQQALRESLPYPEISDPSSAVDILAIEPAVPVLLPPAERVGPLPVSIADNAEIVIKTTRVESSGAQAEPAEFIEADAKMAIASPARDRAGPMPSTSPETEQIPAPVAALGLPALKMMTATTSRDRLGVQQLNSTSREDAAVGKISPVPIDVTETSIRTESELRTLTDRLDVSQKPPSVAITQVPSVVTDSALPLHGTNTPARTASLPLVSTHIEIPVLDDRWGDALNDRVLWMAGRTIKSAEIRLNTAELGPIRIQVLVEDDVAKVAFSAPHAVTREAIELALPRLREMLSENGMSLANTTVSDADVQQEQHARDKNAPAQSDEFTEQTTDATILQTPLMLRSSSALVDTYA